MSASEGSDRIRVVVVDDHPSYAQGLEMLLRSVVDDIEVVAIAKDHKSAIDAVRTHLPDVVLMDIRMPGADGIEITKQIRESFPVVKVVMLTASEDDQDVFDAMSLGASGYLPKQIEVEELVAAIRSISAGQVVISPQVAGKLLGQTTGEAVPLTESERELLRLVAEGHDNAKIAEVMSVSESTLKRNLRNILEKLHLHNRIQAAVYAAKKGWI
ncbi:MAG: response regulator [Actinomycetota bacterium]